MRPLISGVPVGVAVAVCVPVCVAVGVMVGVLLVVAVGATAAPSQPPSQVSAASKTVLLHVAPTQSCAQVSEVAIPSTQNAAPVQLRHTQHIASTVRGAAATRSATARSRPTTPLVARCTVPPLLQLRIASSPSRTPGHWE